MKTIDTDIDLHYMHGNNQSLLYICSHRPAVVGWGWGGGVYIYIYIYINLFNNTITEIVKGKYNSGIFN